jgi:hypothetical protein
MVILHSRFFSNGFSFNVQSSLVTTVIRLL